MPNIFRLFILMFFLFVTTNSFSQNQSLKFEHISTADGLSQINVFCIMQDSRGFMWIGTRDGLNRYDGYKFIVYKNEAKDEMSISNNFIDDILEDAKGN